MCNDLFEGKMTDPEAIARFVYAGNALFTIQSKKTGARFTYKVKKKRGDKKSTLRFVQVLSGPNNTDDYAYLGYVQAKKQGQVFAGRKGKPESASFKALDWALAQVCADKMPEQLEFFHSGQCGACGRTLTVPESIESGLGPICAGRMS